MGHDNRSYVILGLIVLLCIAISQFMNFGVGGTDPGDNYDLVYYSYLVATHGFGYLYNVNTINPFNTQFLIIGIPAAIFRLFGTGTLQESLFEIICFIGAAISIFFIGSKLHSQRVGLLAVLIFGLMPSTLMELGSAGDGLPDAFAISLAVLLIMIAIDKDSNIYYAASGFVVASGPLWSSELSVISMVFILPLLAYSLLKKRNSARITFVLAFISGIIIALALVFLLGWMLTGKPAAYFLARGGATPLGLEHSAPFGYFIQILLPFAQGPPNMPWPWPSIAINTPLQIGFFGYFAVVCIVYLVATRKRVILFPLAWFVLTFIYLGLGTDSIYVWNFIPEWARYIIVATPAMSLLISLGIVEFLSLGKRQVRKGHKIKHSGRSMKAARTCRYITVKYLLVTIVMIAIITNGIALAWFINYTQAEEHLYPIYRAAEFVDSLPPGSSIYLVSGLLNTSFVGAGSLINSTVQNVTGLNNNNYLAVAFRAGYNYNYNWTVAYANCSKIPAGSYVISIDAYLQYVNFHTNASYAASLSHCANLHELLEGPASNQWAEYGVTPIGNLTIYRSG